MGKSRTGPATRIRAICKSRNIDETSVYAKAKKLLEIYRDVCWDTADYADRMKESITCDYCSGSLESSPEADILSMMHTAFIVFAGLSIAGLFFSLARDRGSERS